MLENIKAVLFDLDGTLLDSMGIWYDIDFEFLNERKIIMPENLQRDIAGMSMQKTAAYFRKEFAIEDSEETLMMQWNEMAMEEYRYKIQVKKGVFHFLQYLKKNKIEAAVVTSNSKELVRAAFDKNNFDEYIQFFVTTNEVEHSKPAPDAYLLAADRLHVQPQNCLVFEDIVEGILSGKNAGMKVCAVFDSNSMDTDNEKKRLADYFIHDFDEIPEVRRDL